MKFGTATLLLACLMAAASQTDNRAAAFSMVRPATRQTAAIATHQLRRQPAVSILRMSLDEDDDEIARLKAMAQKLRSEAASLEAKQAEERANIAMRAFEKFDDNSDGKISLAELKKGLEASLKTEISDERIQQLMNKFDVSGDGYLQLEEMVSVDQFRNQLEAFSREEKARAREAAIEAQKEEEAAKAFEARVAILNDKEPTQNDKIISILPYLFPLMDSLQFGRYFIIDNADNPLVGILALLFAAYRSIPFSGFLAFIALNTLSNNPGLNKLVRFNMQQAIFIDIALFFPGLIGALFGALGGMAGVSVPQVINQAGSTAIFGALVLVVTYASISSLLGVTPDKIPLISKAVEDRMPTIDMFDDEGRFVPRQMREGENNDDEKKDGKKD